MGMKIEKRNQVYYFSTFLTSSKFSQHVKVDLVSASFFFQLFMPIFFRFQQSGRPPSNRPGGSGRFPVQRGGGQSNTQNNYHQQRLRTPYNNQSSNGPMNNGGPSGDNRNNQANRSNYNSNNSSGAPMSNNRNRPNNERPGQQNKSQVIGLSFFFCIGFY